MRFTIDEYSQRFKMSKEMVQSRLRDKKLNYIIEEGTTYIIVPRSSLNEPQLKAIDNAEVEAAPTAPKAKAPAPAKPKTTVATIIALYQKENRHLKEKITQLEAKIDGLIADKEQMLRDERDRIEQVYSNKDEQLKNILELINTKLMLTQKSEVHDVDVAQDEPIDASWDHKDFVELRQYLKSLDIKSSDRKTIRRRFAEAFGSDVRIIQQNGQFFLDFSKYDYSDLLKH
jgi:small-conductance mechanosensitive channel